MLAAPVFESTELTNDAVSLTWSTEAGALDQLQFNSNLSSSNWTDLGNPLRAIGTTLNATDSLTNGPKRFYRVILSP